MVQNLNASLHYATPDFLLTQSLALRNKLNSPELNVPTQTLFFGENADPNDIPEVTRIPGPKLEHEYQFNLDPIEVLDAVPLSDEVSPLPKNISYNYGKLALERILTFLQTYLPRP